MAHEPEWAHDREKPRRRVGLSAVVLVVVGIWLTSEAIGAVLGIVRRVVTVVVVAVLLFVGWRVARAGKS